MYNQQPAQVNNTQQVLYTFKSKKFRILIPKILQLIVLSTLFYFGILVNIGLLKLDAEFETMIKSGALLVIGLLVLIGFLVNLKKASNAYKYFQHEIKHGRKSISYSEIQNVEKKQGLGDKMFSTYSLKLSKKFSIEAIPNSVDLVSYTQQMVNYSKTLPAGGQSYY
jgi:hypothetical protein